MDTLIVLGSSAKDVASVSRKSPISPETVACPSPPHAWSVRASCGLLVKSQEIVQPERLCEGGGCQTTINAKEAPRMDMHKNARTTPHSRALIAERVNAGEAQAAVARSFGLCDRTCLLYTSPSPRDS